MKIIDEDTLSVFRWRIRCEWCSCLTRPIHPHHVFSRGAGRADVPFNLVALCMVCHDKFHASSLTGKGRKADVEALLVIIANRDSWGSTEAVRRVIMALRRVME